MNLRGLTVSRISVGHQLFLHLDSDARVDLGCPFKLTRPVGEGRQDVLIDPGGPPTAACVCPRQRCCSRPATRSSPSTTAMTS
ncbi:DUF6188 family protein [Kitasatospora purpeofusca]|uniref:DUF6188 family protein n=1 Tax=Kitasatospora purpeofusca TaxID=67352 RepID=UPI0033CFB382